MATQPVPGNYVNTGYGPFFNAGAPTNGTSGTFANRALPGAILIDTTNKDVYKNTNTQASPTWTVLAPISDGGLTPVKLDTTLGPAIGGTPTLTVGAEAGNVINVAVQLKDVQGNAIAVKTKVNAWISDAAGGALAGTAPNGSVAIGTNGVIIDTLTTKKSFTIVTDASGRFDLNIGDSGTPTFYLNISVGGKVFSSAAVTFA